MILNYSSSFELLDDFVASYNTSQDSHGTRVRQAMVSTMKEILRIYGAFLRKACTISEIAPANLPTLRTNNVQLARRTHASGRTIKRHINRLINSGIITQKIGHGSNASYELCISPEILWINGVGPVHNPSDLQHTIEKIAADNQSDTNLKPTSCPHTETYKKTYKRNNRIITVDKLDNPPEEETEKVEVRSSLPLTAFSSTSRKCKKKTKKTRRKDPLNEDARRKDAWREAGKTGGENAQKRQTGARNFHTDRKHQEENPAHNADRHAFLSTYVQELWSFAVRELYNDVWLNKRQQRLGVRLIYDWYASVTPGALEKAHQQYKRRIRMVREYVKKDPDHRFVPLPFQFFDVHNPNGFRKSKQWYEAEQEHLKFLELQRITSATIRKFKRNQEKDTGQGVPPLELFRQCEQRIGKLGVPRLLDRFYASCSPLLQKEYISELNYK